MPNYATLYAPLPYRSAYTKQGRRFQWYASYGYGLGGTPCHGINASSSILSMRHARYGSSR